MKNNITRRNFVKKSAGVAIGTAILPTIITSCSNTKGANDRIVVGHIGTGDRGTAELMYYFLPLKEALNVAVCDVFRDRRESAAKSVNDFYRKNDSRTDVCTSYLEMDELLQRSDIDAVHITTPDHWHVLAAIKAARAGKHIMLAKPLGLSYPENLVLAKELKKNNVKFHYGTQQRSYEHTKLAYDLINDGAIGEIEKVLVWAPGYNDVQSPVCNEVPVPSDFDFERWTGPAPMRPYCPERVTNNSSWFNWDYSIGFLGGWGAHPLDMMVWMIKDRISGTYSCEGTGKFWPAGGLYDNIRAWDVVCRYENGPEVHFVSDDVAQQGLLKHLRINESNGTTFYGSRGWISVSRSSVQSDINEIDQKLNNFPKDSSGWLKSEQNTMGKRFISVIKGTEPELSPLDEAIMSDTISHMSNIAIRTGRKVTWDPQKGEIREDSEANKLYIREMRAPFIV